MEQKNREEKKCNHRIKRNYPFGKKSKPKMRCKDCGIVITNKMLQDIKAEREKKIKKKFKY
jgi:hypothetical protein